MKCINKILIFSTGLLLTGAILSGCGGETFDMAYSPDQPVSSYRLTAVEEERGLFTPFASGLCVADGDVPGETGLDLSNVSSAALFQIDSGQTLYAKNIHEKLAPASLTKLMTALVAVKYGSSDAILTASSNVKITEAGAQTCGIKEGDKMTLDQALHVLLINSANDAAVLIAEGIGGSVEGFCDLMNKEAKTIGATNSNFVNPHGLTADNHYVTAYDMYLIFNAAIQNPLISEIISMPSYTTVYKDKNGDSKELSVNSTNQFLTGKKDAPETVTVIGGKTGTTTAAGHCLILLSRDSSGQSYISVIMRSEGEALYDEMAGLLGEIQN